MRLTKLQTTYDTDDERMELFMVDVKSTTSIICFKFKLKA